MVDYWMAVLGTRSL